MLTPSGGRIANPFKGNIIILVKNKLESTGVYTIEQHKTEVEKELLERNYKNLVRIYRLNNIIFLCE